MVQLYHVNMSCVLFPILFPYKHIKTHGMLTYMTRHAIILNKHAVLHKKSIFLKTFLICYKKIFLAIAGLEARIVNFCYNTPFGVLRIKTSRL